MVNKIKKVFLLFFFILISSSVSAQENYYIQDTEDGAIFIQKFSWQENPDVLKYIFTIEKLNKKGKYELVEKIETEQNFVEVSLSAGHYRYKLVLFNFLNLPEYESDWYPVDVIKAYQPKISDVSPDTIYLEEEQDGIFVINGYELREDTEFILKDGLKELKPIKVDKDSKNKKVKLYFNPNDLDTGNFSIIAKNVGGLKYEYKPIKIQFKKQHDFDISGGYSMIFVPSDNTFKNYFGKSQSLLGLALKATYIFKKTKSNYYGLSLNLNNFYYSNQLENWELSSLFTIANINFNIQIPFDEKTKFLDFHIGGGLTTFYDIHFNFPHNIKSPALTTLSPNVNFGMQFIIYPMKRLFVSLTVDTTLTLNLNFSNKEMSMYMLAIMPTLEIGYQF